MPGARRRDRDPEQRAEAGAAVDARGRLERARDAPRTRPRSSHTISGSQNATLTITSATIVSLRPRFWTASRIGIASTIAGTIWVKISTAMITPLPGRPSRASGYAASAPTTSAITAVTTVTTRLWRIESIHAGSVEQLRVVREVELGRQAQWQRRHGALGLEARDRNPDDRPEQPDTAAAPRRPPTASRGSQRGSSPTRTLRLAISGCCARRASRRAACRLVGPERGSCDSSAVSSSWRRVVRGCGGVRRGATSCTARSRPGGRSPAPRNSRSSAA